ncbi:MAG: histidine phosphatase family protein [Chloroflexi bacterium]|nr:histidine phosphatase family protein [Chloroflexota bacterium]MCC6895285.1 histidine phosphatase family protein [Anaerolineae bacterium]
MTHLYLIRHADNIDGLIDGKMGDLGLSPEGITQAERLRDRLTHTNEIKPDVFIASPERRAKETSEIIAPAFGLPITFDRDFEEWRSDDGSIEPDAFMRRWAEVPKTQKAYYRWIEGFESRAELGLRVSSALNRVIQQHAGKTLVIVTHGAFLQMSFGYFFGYGEAVIDRAIPEIRRTSITHWYQNEGQDRWNLERSNDYHHLLD